jgi:hypothetical protein
VVDLARRGVEKEVEEVREIYNDTREGFRRCFDMVPVFCWVCAVVEKSQGELLLSFIWSIPDVLIILQ